jgi:hypothetical protein
MEKLPTRQDLVRKVILPGSIGAEIGVFRGDFAVIMAQCPLAALHLIDPWIKYKEYERDACMNNSNHEENLRETQRKLAQDIARGRVIIHRGFSADIAVQTMFMLDWFYLDAFHIYPEVIQDLRLWSKRLKPGGFIMGHDYIETTQWARTLEFGVVKAVNQFCAEEGWEIQYLTSELDWPSYCLRKK